MLTKKTSIQQSSNFSTNNLGEENGSYGGCNSKQQQLSEIIDGLICINLITIMILLFLQQVPRTTILYVEIAFLIIFTTIIGLKDEIRYTFPKMIKIKKYYKETKINILNNKNNNKNTNNQNTNSLRENGNIDNNKNNKTIPNNKVHHNPIGFFTNSIINNKNNNKDR